MKTFNDLELDLNLLKAKDITNNIKQDDYLKSILNMTKGTNAKPNNQIRQELREIPLLEKRTKVKKIYNNF